MRKRRGFVPGAVARLEERVVLSPGLAADLGPSVAVTPQVQLDLRGTVAGVESPSADRLRLFGRGEVAPLGQVQAFGTLTNGTLTMTLAARRGDVFVHIYGIVGGQGRYDVTGGTGAYRGATGHGAVTYDPRYVGGHAPSFPPGPGRPYPQVMFTLKFGGVRGLET